MTCNHQIPHPNPECQDDWWICGKGITRIKGIPHQVRVGNVSNEMDDLEICDECEHYTEGDVDPEIPPEI